MAEKRALYKKRIFFILSGVLLIICTTGFFFWRNYKYRLASRKIDKLVTEKSKGLYQINYQHLIINEALGNITAVNVEILPDSLVYQTLDEQHKQPKNLYYIKIPRMSISGVKTPKALLNKEISAHMIELENAEIEIRLGKAYQEKKTEIKLNMGADIYRQLLGNLKSITADSVVLKNAALTVVDLDSKKLRCKVEGLSLRFSGMAIDSLKEHDSTRILFSDDLAIHGNQVFLPLPNKTYLLEISGMDFNSRTGSFHTNQISLKPGMSESAFARSHKYAIDRLDLTLASLDMWGLNQSALLRQQLEVDSLELDRLSFHIFRDKSFPHDSVDRTHDYPSEAIMKWPVPIHIKKIRIRDGYIEYKEKNDKSDSSGKVAFFHVQATIEQMTNMPVYIRQNNQMRVHFNASFLDASPFSAQIRLRLADKNGDFHMDAQLGKMEAPTLNVLLKPMALAEADKGKINSLRYHLDASNRIGKGKLMLQYENISIKLLKKDENKNKYKTKVLPTLAAGLLVKDSNPQHGKTRLAKVEYTRDIHRSIFNLMWKSLFAAIKEVVL